MVKNDFEIFDLKAFQSGDLAICKEPSSANDFKMVSDWSADVIVTMINVEEFADPRIRRQNFQQCPAMDPSHSSRFWDSQTDFSTVIERLLTILNAQGRVLIHCKGGQGRSGMLALRLLVDQGEAPQAALARLRAIRPHAVETKAQEIWATDRH